MHINLTENFLEAMWRVPIFVTKNILFGEQKNDGVGEEGKDKNKKGNLKIPEEIGWKECKMKKNQMFPRGQTNPPPPHQD